MKFRDPERQFRQRIELQITNTLGVSRALIEEMEAFSLTTSQEPQQPQAGKYH